MLATPGGKQRLLWMPNSELAYFNGLQRANMMETNNEHVQIHFRDQEVFKSLCLQARDN